MDGNKPLTVTEKVHGEGSPLRESWQNGMMKVVDPSKDQIEDKPVANELTITSNEKSERTPIKMLIAKEMSKETDSRTKTPNLVAKLMGLDDLPTQQPVYSARQSFLERPLGNGSAGMGFMAKHQKENLLTDEQMRGDIQPSKACPEETPKYENLHEVWRQVQEIDISKDDWKLKGRYKLSPDEKIALVSKKFFEAEHLAADGKFHQDAMEILSLNRELFIEFLQEPRSLFTTQFCELHSIPPPPKTKCITILKPKKTVETNMYAGQRNGSESQSKKVLETNKWKKKKTKLPSALIYDNSSSASQPTRIVILKPSHGKTRTVKAVLPPPISASTPPQSPDVDCKQSTGGARDYRATANDNAQQAQECVISDKRGDALPSSAASNGYIEDGDFFNGSEDKLIEEGKLSDSGNATPNSRQPSNFVNRSTTPCSPSSLSQASYSPESAVTREAKRRLSERLAMMKSSGNNEEKRERSSLGEMLALPELSKPIRSNKDCANQGPSISSSRSCGVEKELRAHFTCLPIGWNGEQEGKYSPKGLLRSKSVPASSTVDKKVGLSGENPVLTDDKPITLKKSVKPKSGKSFKGKLSSLLFSRNKKPSKWKTNPHPSLDSNDKSQSPIAEMQGFLTEINEPSIENRSTGVAVCCSDDGLEAELPLNAGGPLDGSSIFEPFKQSNVSFEEVSTPVKNGMPETLSERQEQPSPNSVLEAAFEDNSDLLQPENSSTDYTGSSFSASMKSKVTATSGSPAARSLSWDKDSAETSNATALEPLLVSPTANEEGEWYWFAQTLLASVGLNYRKSGSFPATWHSPASPLDPSLLDKFICENEDKELQDENKYKQQRSEQMLIFDTINAALTDMAGSRFNTQPCNKRVRTSSPVIEELWNQLRDWFSIEGTSFSCESDPWMSIERAVNEDLGEKRWEEMMRLDCIGMEIEGKILDELVIEALGDLTCK
ncbi:hypothetical protein ACLOJK_007530 [Asimina triloba]